MSAASATARRWFVPEVVQISRMDCGPAALSALLAGFGVRVDYGRLREACQTDVDGTSIDTLEDIAVQLGLDAEQVLVPVDHLAHDARRLLPAVVVVRQPDSALHFVVAWRRCGALVEVMDPSAGRRWMRWDSFRRDVFVHRARMSEAAVREWAGSSAFIEPLERRLRALGVRGRERRAALEAALADESVAKLAALDAAVRLLEKLVSAGGLRPGGAAAQLLQRLAQARHGDGLIPDELWTLAPARGRDGGRHVTLRGAVLLSARGRAGVADRRSTLGERTPATPLSDRQLTELRTRRAPPWRRVLGWLRREGGVKPAALMGALLVAAATVTAQALLLRGIVDLGRPLAVGAQRLGAVAMLVAFFVALVMVQLPIHAVLVGIGRRLEVTVRAAFAAKVPRIGDRYFHSRLVSDMADRAHSLGSVRGLPQLAAGAVTTVLQTLFTLAAIAWLTPTAFVPALVAVTVAMGLALLAQRWLAERDLRARGHRAVLARWYLDAFLGSWCIRAHGAGQALQREQESVLVEWTTAQVRLRRAAIAADALQALCGLAASAWLLFGHLSRTGNEGATLLLAYWAVSLPALGQSLAALTQQLPAVRNTLARLLEPLDAPEEYAEPRACSSARSEGAEIVLQGVTVHAGGHEVLAATDLRIAAGSHVAVVGESGAGKSTLVGLLLGWHRPAQGVVLVDGRPLDDAGLAQLRQETAWVDPAVRLFNRRFLDNLAYGQRRQRGLGELGHALESSGLREVLERLPQGMQTPLGEGGARLSGGEGQRVRLGRAMLRGDARLTILDEPFRGLDRERRSALLGEARRRWVRSTILCVTHDIEETLAFDRVLVVEAGRVVEDGSPRNLAVQQGTRFAALLAAEHAVRRSLWAGAGWRRWRVEAGNVAELRPLRAETQPGPRPLRAGGGRL
jgi:ATP-binding cassette subfamily B protein